MRRRASNSLVVTTTKAQDAILERAFTDNPKPSRSLQKDLGDSVGFHVRQVQTWFENRRQRSKLARLSVEQRTREALEQASASRQYQLGRQQHQHMMTSSSSSDNSSPASSFHDSNSPSTVSPSMSSGFSSVPELENAPSTPRPQMQNRSQSESQLNVTPTPAHPHPGCSSDLTDPNNQSPYASPQEASYASLARSLAVAAAAAATNNAFVAQSQFQHQKPDGIAMLGHNPFFNGGVAQQSLQQQTSSSFAGPTFGASMMRTLSAYSDTSSLPSAVQTPLESACGQNTPASLRYPEFADAIESRNNAQPILQPPRSNKSDSIPTTPLSSYASNGRPIFGRQMSYPEGFLGAFQSVDLTSATIPEASPNSSSTALPFPTLKPLSKRRRPQLSPLAVGMQRSQSSLGDCLSATSYFRPRSGTSPSSSPFDTPMKQPMLSPPKEFGLHQVATSAPTSPLETRSFGQPATKSLNSVAESFKVQPPRQQAPPTPVSPGNDMSSVTYDSIHATPTKTDIQLKVSQSGDAFLDLTSPPQTPCWHNAPQVKLTPSNTVSMLNLQPYAMTDGSNLSGNQVYSTTSFDSVAPLWYPPMYEGSVAATSFYEEDNTMSEYITFDSSQLSASSSLPSSHQHQHQTHLDWEGSGLQLGMDELDAGLIVM